jgi:hypothetical protein
VDVVFSFHAGRRRSTPKSTLTRAPEPVEKWTGSYHEGLFSAHRLALLWETPAFKTDLDLLNALVADILYVELLGTPLPGRSKGETQVDGVVHLGETSYRKYRALCRAFENKWRTVSIPMIDGASGQFVRMLFEDSIYPREPVALAGRVPDQVITLAESCPGRFVVVDGSMRWEDIRALIRVAVPDAVRTSGKKIREFRLRSQQAFERDVRLIRANPKRARDYAPFRSADTIDTDAELRDLKKRVKQLQTLVAPPPDAEFP